jgi:hypothetical protein
LERIEDRLIGGVSDEHHDKLEATWEELERSTRVADRYQQNEYRSMVHVVEGVRRFFSSHDPLQKLVVMKMSRSQSLSGRFVYQGLKNTIAVAAKQNDEIHKEKVDYKEATFCAKSRDQWNPEKFHWFSIQMNDVVIIQHHIMKGKNA